MSRAGTAASQSDLFALLPDASPPPLAVEPASHEPAYALRAMIQPANPMTDHPGLPVSGSGADVPLPLAPDSPQADGKDPEAFRTIGEVAKALAIAPHVLRYWEEQFPMLRPVKRSGARRYYRPEDIALVQAIDRLVHAEGYTLRGARQLLEAEAKAARGLKRAGQPQASGAPQSAKGQVKPVAQPPSQSASAVLSQLRAIRSTLAEALRRS